MLVLCGQCFKTYRFACICMGFQASTSKVTRKDRCVAFWLHVLFVMLYNVVLTHSRHSKSNVRKSNSIELNPWIEFD